MTDLNPSSTAPHADRSNRGDEPLDLSVVVPVYRAEASLAELVRRTVAVLDSHRPRWEVLLVNDGSGDGSWRVIRQLAAEDPRVVGIDLGRNYGQHNALLAGLRSARGAVTVTLDDDLQNPPEEIPTLLAALERQAAADTGGQAASNDRLPDVVYGVPEKKEHGLLRGLATRLTKWVLASSLGIRSIADVAAFRAFRTHLRDRFATYSGPSVNLDVLLAWSSDRFTSVNVRHEPRRHGRSHYTLRRLVAHTLNLVTGFSVLPLQAAGLLGLACAAFGLAILLYAVINFLVRGAAVPGFAFLASIIAIFSGAQLLALGIIGEYLARMHLRTMGRPAYTVRQTTAEGQSAQARAPRNPEPTLPDVEDAPQ